MLNWEYRKGLDRILRAMPLRMRGARRVGVQLAKWGLAVVLLWWLIDSGRLDVAAILQLDVGWALAGVVVGQLLMLALPIVRWMWLARALGLSISGMQAVHIGMLGYFANIFLPTGIGIDGVKLVYMKRVNAHRTADVLSTLIMNRVMGMSSLALIGLIALTVFLVHSGHKQLERWLLVMVVLLALLGLGTALCGSRRMASFMRTWIPWARIHRVVESFGQYRAHKSALMASFLISLASHGAAIAAAWFAFQLFHEAVPLLTVFALTPLINLSGVIPITPLGLGVADSVAAELYQWAQWSKGAETTMVLRIVTVMLSSLGVIGFIYSRGMEGPSDLASR